MRNVFVLLGGGIPLDLDLAEKTKYLNIVCDIAFLVKRQVHLIDKSHDVFPTYLGDIKVRQVHCASRRGKEVTPLLPTECALESKYLNHLLFARYLQKNTTAQPCLLRTLDSLSYRIATRFTTSRFPSDMPIRGTTLTASRLTPT